MDMSVLIIPVLSTLFTTEIVINMINYTGYIPCSMCWFIYDIYSESFCFY